MATHAVEELVKFVFNATSAEFIMADANDGRPHSQATFEKNNFIKVFEIKEPDAIGYEETLGRHTGGMNFISLDEGKTYILPYYRSGGGNYYLSRQRWQRLQAEKNS